MKRLIQVGMFVILSFSLSLSAENPGNPFDGSEGAGGFDEPTDNEGSASDDFGFSPPPTPFEPSSPTAEAAPTIKNMVERFRNIPSQPVPAQPSARSLSPGPSLPTASSAKKSATAPRLQDYLELDETVKGLEVKSFDLQDKEIKDVVLLISKWTGKNFILDQKVRGKITIIGPSQVSLQEAYQAFLSSLDANNLTTVQSGKFIRIIETAEARRAPVKTYSGTYAPRDDQYITRIFQLKYINAEEVQREFRDLVTRQGKLFAYEPTNSIIITDTGSNIHRLREMLDALDVKTHETGLHVLKINHSSAKTIADMLTDIYGETQSTRPGQPRTFRRGALERSRGGGIVTKIIPDEQTNSLIVLANSVGFKQISQTVGKLDVRSKDNGKIHVYYCEHAKAEDLATTLAALASGGSSTSQQSQRPRSQSRSSNSSGANPSGGGTPVSTSSGPVSADFGEGVKITSDASTNALVINGSPGEYQALRKVLKKLDIPRLQVFVESAIMEVSMDDTDEWNLNLGIGIPGRGFGGGFVGDSASLIGALTKSGAATEGVNIPGFIGGPFSTDVRSSATSAASTVEMAPFMAILNILAKETRANVLSTPQIVAIDNQEAEFKVQDKIPMASALTSLGGAGATGVPQVNVEKVDVGIAIKLTPHINATSKMIQLDVDQTIEDVKDSSSVPEALQATTRATTSRMIKTSVVVKDQDYIALGGLMSDRSSEVETKVPLLGDIPVLGWLFKSKSWEKKKTNLVILLHPQIINTRLDTATLVKKQLSRRDAFIKDDHYDHDAHKESIDDLKSKVDQQEQEGKTEPIIDYRKNDPMLGETPPASAATSNDRITNEVISQEPAVPSTPVESPPQDMPMIPPGEEG